MRSKFGNACFGDIRRQHMNRRMLFVIVMSLCCIDTIPAYVHLLGPPCVKNDTEHLNALGTIPCLYTTNRTRFLFPQWDAIAINAPGHTTYWLLSTGIKSSHICDVYRHDRVHTCITIVRGRVHVCRRVNSYVPSYFMFYVRTIGCTFSTSTCIVVNS